MESRLHANNAGVGRCFPTGSDRTKIQRPCRALALAIKLIIALTIEFLQLLLRTKAFRTSAYSS